MLAIPPAIPPTPMPSGGAIYFDGVTSARHDVVVRVTETGLQIIGGERQLLDEWLYPELRRESAPDGVLRLGRRNATRLARLEVRDDNLAAAIEDRAVTLDRSGVRRRQLRRKVIALSFAATTSLVLTGIFGVPALTSRLMPFVPISVEQKLGNAVDRQIRAALDTRRLGARFACGTGSGETEGRQALDKLVGRLAAAAALPVTLRVDVVRRADANAFALPGGHIYVYQGLIAKSETPDELAGVLAHEMGHVAHRDGTRTVLQTAGLSFLFGMMLGDFVGGGAVVIAAKTVLRSSYSRRVEAAADAFSVELMGKVGGDQRALAVILARLVSDKARGIKILLDHPETKDRIRAINAVATAGMTTPILTGTEWAALKQICAPLPASPAKPNVGNAAKPSDGDGAVPPR